METLRYRHRHLDVACELQAADAAAQAGEWRHLREEAGLGCDPIPGGVRLWLRPEARGVAADLARREAGCCGFLDFELTDEAGRLRVDITSPAPEAAAVIASLTGTDPGGDPRCC